MKRRVLGRVSLAVWLVNVLVAVLSYFTNMLWAALPLFIVAMAEWAPAVIRAREHTRERKPPFRKKPPAWVLAAAVVSVLYTFINYIICAVRLGEGGPMEVDGVYCLWNHGFIREISYAEYTRLQGIEGRMFTGHLLAFTGIAMYILWPETEKPDRDNTEGGGSG